MVKPESTLNFITLFHCFSFGFLIEEKAQLFGAQLKVKLCKKLSQFQNVQATVLLGGVSMGIFLGDHETPRELYAFFFLPDFGDDCKLLEIF